MQTPITIRLHATQTLHDQTERAELPDQTEPAGQSDKVRQVPQSGTVVHLGAEEPPADESDTLTRTEDRYIIANGQS